MNYLPRRIDPNAFRQQSEGIDSAQRINGTAPELIGLPVIDPAYLDEQLRRARDEEAELLNDIARLKNEGRAAAYIAGVLLLLVVMAFVYSALP
jgi:uncharacterized membrane protein